jgi:hypothetical protein
VTAQTIERDDIIELSLNQATTRPYPLPETAEVASRAGIGHIGIWIEPVEAIGVAATRKPLADTGLRVSSVCRVGFVADLGGLAQKVAYASTRVPQDSSGRLSMTRSAWAMVVTTLRLPTKTGWSGSRASRTRPSARAMLRSSAGDPQSVQDASAKHSR